MIILNEAKPKYEKLDELLQSQLLDIRFSQQVNIFVDVKEITKKFFRPDISPQTQKPGLLIEEISADIINIISHYRNFFYKKGKYTSFYFLYSSKKCDEMIKLIPDYKKEYYEKYFDSEENEFKIKIIEKVIAIVKKVINYVPNCKFIDTSDYDELVYGKYLVGLTNPNEINLVLTNDQIMFQLINKHTFVLNLKGIKSKLITMENCIKELVGDDEVQATSNMLPLVLALAGNKKYAFKNIPSIATIKAVNIVENLLEKNLAIDIDSIDIPIQYPDLDESDKLQKVLIQNREKIAENYRLIRNDILLYSHESSLAANISIPKKTVGLNMFLDLNAKIFTTYPILLDMLLKGEKI